MFWYDGKLIADTQITLPIDEPGLLYGATVFTTLRVYEQSLEHPLTQWQAHLRRLQNSIEKFAWQTPPWKKIAQGAQVLLRHYPVLRITLFPKGKEWIIGRHLPSDLSQRQQEGIYGWVAENTFYARSLPYHKTGNYLAPWLAQQEAQRLASSYFSSPEKKATEAILRDKEGNWLETSTGNLWGWRDGIWWTPALCDGILPGIGRSQIIANLQRQGIAVRENRWSADFVINLEAIAISNAVVEVVPFRKIIFANKEMILHPSHVCLSYLRGCFPQ